MIFTSLTFLYKYKCTLSIYLSPHSVSRLHPGVFQPPKLTKWEKRMKWEMDYSRADVRLWNQTSVQRWVNWISLPSVPSPGPPVSAEVPRSPGLFWEIKHLSAQLAAEAAVLSFVLAVSFSSVYMWELWEAPLRPPCQEELLRAKNCQQDFMFYGSLSEHITEAWHLLFNSLHSA